MGLTQEELQKLRINYKRNQLDESHVSGMPQAFFETWFKEALDSGCDEPNAFILSTVRDGQPRGRVVLLKGFHEGGIVFYTNYDSPKGVELAQAGKASATFVWLPLERQVRIEGAVERVPGDLSDRYFAGRPRGSQVGAWASPQGEVVSSRQALEELFSQAAQRFPEGTSVPRPENWGGFVLKPHRWEFWQGRENRMHDRIVCRWETGQWLKERLAP